MLAPNICLHIFFFFFFFLVGGVGWAGDRWAVRYNQGIGTRIKPRNGVSISTAVGNWLYIRHLGNLAASLWTLVSNWFPLWLFLAEGSLRQWDAGARGRKPLGDCAQKLQESSRVGVGVSKQMWAAVWSSFYAPGCHSQIFQHLHLSMEISTCQRYKQTVS